MKTQTLTPEIARQLNVDENQQGVVVVGVESERFGVRPIPFIKMMGDRVIDAEAVRAFMRERIEGFKVPDTFHEWPDGVSVVKPSRKYFAELAGRMG